jgi:hypothetical protein
LKTARAIVRELLGEGEGKGKDINGNGEEDLDKLAFDNVSVP